MPDSSNFTFETEIKIKKKLLEYRSIPTKNFINESYFLYDRSNLLKKTFITALNKEIALYGSFSFFSGKTSIGRLPLISTESLVKFFI